MPRKPRKTKNMKPQPISPELRAFFESGACGHQTEEDFTIFLLCCDDQKLRAAWNLYRDQVTANFIERNPGSRPYAWWQFDAPGSRQRIGGIGTPSCEVLAYAPSLAYGLPTKWISDRDVKFYNQDGNFRGVAVDPEDPPTFESQAAYLDRHGLLTFEEKIHLRKHTELMEPERVECEK